MACVLRSVCGGGGDGGRAFWELETMSLTKPTIKVYHSHDLLLKPNLLSEM